jgi:hypothetical protein
VNVTVALSTLLGYDEQAGEIDGGPVPNDLLLRIAPGGPPACGGESGTWKRLVTDHLGRLIDHGRSTYRPPADLKKFVIARDRTCRFPHCNLPAGYSPAGYAFVGGGTPIFIGGGPPLRRTLRTRPPPRLGGRRTHQRRQPAGPVRPAPPPETRRRLELTTTTRRVDRMDQPGRARLPQTAPDLSHRPNPRPTRSCRARLPDTGC